MVVVEFQVEFGDGNGPADVEITLSGAPTPTDLRRLNERLVSDLRFQAGLTILADLNALDAGDLSDAAVQKLSEPMVERDWFYPPVASAIIAPEGPTYNAARAYRAHLGGSESKRRIFKCRAEALAWLDEQKRR